MNRDIINQAINNKKVLEFYYDDKQRIVEPYVVGKTSKNKSSLLSIQIGGYTSSGKLPDWRMFEIEKIKDIRIHKRKFAAYFQAYQDEARRPLYTLYKIIGKALDINEQVLMDLQDRFNESIEHIEGKPYWRAKDLRKLLGYSRWSSLYKIICKASSLHEIEKAIKDGNDNYSIIEPTQNILLTAESCLTIATLADFKKKEVIFARLYFATELSINYNIRQEHVEGLERIRARMRLSETERHLSSMICKNKANEKSLGSIRSAGDSKLFGGLNTAKIKERLGAKKNQALSDLLPDILIKAKEFAAALTGYNIRVRSISDPYAISRDHGKNNGLVRYILSKNNIIPEDILSDYKS